MAENAAARALRLLDLVPYILNNQGISVESLARKFGVSRDEIIKDLNLLFVCGLPGYTPLELIDLSLEDDVVIVRDPQNLNRPRGFTYSESIVLRIALAALQNLIPSSNPNSKVLEGLRKKFDDMYSADVPAQAININLERDEVTIKLIEKTIQQGAALNIRYLNVAKDEVTTRCVVPDSIKLGSPRPQLYGFCHLANSKRTFNIEQILEAELVDRPEVGLSQTAEIQGTIKLTVVINSFSGKFWLENRQRLIPLSDNEFVMDVYDTSWILRTALSDGSFSVLAPQEVREAINVAADKALAAYK